MKNLRNILMVIFLFSAFAKTDTRAASTSLSAAATQCAMCRAVLESEEDNSTAKGINNGIKYLMIIPYILVGGVFYFVYKSRKNTTKDKQ